MRRWRRSCCAARRRDSLRSVALASPGLARICDERSGRVGEGFVAANLVGLGVPVRPARGQTCPPCGRTTPDGRRGSKAPSPTLPLCSRRAGARFNRSARDRVTGWSKCDVVRAWQGLPCASGAPISRVSTAARRTSRPTAGRSGTALGKRTKHGSPCHVRATRHATSSRPSEPRQRKSTKPLTAAQSRSTRSMHCCKHAAKSSTIGGLTRS